MIIDATNPDVLDAGRRPSDGTSRLGRSNRAATIAIALILALFTGLTFGILRLATDAVTRQVHDRVQTNAAVGVTYVEEAIGGIVDLARAFSVDPELLDAVGDGTPTDVDAARVETIFGPAARRSPGISLMAVITLRGDSAAISPRSPELLGVDFSYRDWFRGVQATDAVYVSEAYVSRFAGNPRVVGIAAPIRSSAGTTIAYVLITYEVGEIDAFIDRFANRGVSFTVTDQRGVVVGAPGPTTGELVSLRGDPGVDAALAGNELQEDRVVGDEQVVTAHAPIPDLGWTVSADVSASTAYAAVRNLRTTVLALAGVTMLGLGGAVAAIGRSGRGRRRAEARALDAAREIAADRTRLRVSLAETQAAEAQYRTLTDHLPDTAVMVWDAELRLETVTGPGAKTWRYTERGVMPGRLLEEIVDEEESAKLRPFYESGLVTPGTLEYFSVATGLTFQFDVAPMPNTEGEPERVLVMVRDITERKQLDLQLQHLADHDALTGLLNRRGFEAELDRHVDNVARHGASGALLLLDLDHFKQINDILGHSVGDEVISSAASALRGRLRASDVIGRLGGDEFAVILHRVDRAQAETVAHSLLDAVRNEVAIVTDNEVCQPTVSIGIAVFDPAGVTAKQTIINADLAMYRAKAAGRDGFATHAELDAVPSVRTHAVGAR